MGGLYGIRLTDVRFDAVDELPIGTLEHGLGLRLHLGGVI